MIKYAPIEGRGRQPLPEFISKKKAIINILNEDERCFGYALLYFLDRDNLTERNGNCFWATLYKEKMFQRHHLENLPYPISPNDVHLYVDLIQMNINVFSFFDDEGRACYSLAISRKNYERLGNLIYGHYASITNTFNFFRTLQSMATGTRFACVVLDTFKQMKLSLVTRSFAPETTSCRCSMCSLHQAPNRCNSNFTTTNFALWRRSWSMQTLKPS